MQSKAATVPDYLAELPADQRAVLAAMRKLIRKNMDARYQEGMQYGMIGYFVPHRIYPAGYHCDPRQPLPFVALAAQKNYFSIYMMGLYTEGEQEQFRRRWAATGKKLDMGKSCIRFKKLDDLALDLIAEAIRRMPVDEYIALYEAATQRPGARPSRSAAKTTATESATRTAKASAPKASAAASQSAKRPAQQPKPSGAKSSGAKQKPATSQPTATKVAPRKTAKSARTPARPRPRRSSGTARPISWKRVPPMWSIRRAWAVLAI